MNDQTRDVVMSFFGRLGESDISGALELLTDDVEWDIPGDTALVPWLGRRSGPDEVAECFTLLLKHCDREAFDVERVLVDGSHAVVFAHGKLTVRSTGKLIDTRFAIDITVAPRGRISRYVIFEDSWAVAEAVRA